MVYSTIEYLKQRISHLEAILQDAGRSSNTPLIASPTTHKVPSTLATSAPRRRQAVLQPAAPVDPVDNALSQIGVLSLNAMGHSATSASGIADRVASSSLVLEATALPARRPSSAFANYRQGRLTSDAVLFKTPVDLNYDALGTSEAIGRFSDCASLYLSGIAGFKCFDIFADWQNAQRNGTATSLLDTQPEVVLLSKLMLAIGICMDSKRESFDLLVSALTQDLAQNIIRLQDDSFLKVLLLQIVLSLCHPLGGAVWPLLGLAMARAISLGLHREDAQLSEGNSEERQGLFWAIFVLDKTIAIATDRPFALADSDTTLSVDTLPLRTDYSGSGPRIHQLRMCMFHHAQLISRMRHGASEDEYFHLINYYHWRDTYQRTIFASGDDALQSLQHSAIRKHGLQLQCRMLVQLSTMLIGGSSDCVAQVCLDVMEAVPAYVNYLVQITSHYALSLTLVDGYEVFAASLVFIHFSLLYIVDRSVRMSLDNMKVVMVSMDLLLDVSKRFAEMRPLRDVVWTFLTACESGVRLGTATSNVAPLEEAIDKADVPRNLAVFMRRSCLRE